LFLLATELNHPARLTEPQTFGWEVTKVFAPAFEVIDERRLADAGDGIDDALRRAVPYDDPASERPGVLVAKLRRRAGQAAGG
jgi:hypothetical protein